MRIVNFCLILFLSFQFLSCKKVEGEGGAANIKGTLIGKKFNSVGTLIAEYPLERHDVYIIYGGNSTYFDDRIETSFDGTFEFRNLQPGTYTVFCYAKDPTAASNVQVLSFSVTIDKKAKKETVNLGLIDVRD
jgi:hypothetical protein